MSNTGTALPANAELWSRLKMEPYGVFKEVTKQCTNKDRYQSVSLSKGDKAGTLAHFCAPSANFAVRYTKSLTLGARKKKTIPRCDVANELTSRIYGEKRWWVLIVNEDE